MGLAEGCKLVRDIEKDQAISYDDVELPEGRLCDSLKNRVGTRYRMECWIY